MALAIDASSPANVTGTTRALTTASFTPPSGSLIVLLFSANDGVGSANVSVSSVTNTGPTITWTRAVLKAGNVAGSLGGAGQPGTAEIWVGTGANGTACTVTATSTDTTTGTGHEKDLQAQVLTGADTTSLTNVAAGSSASGLPSVTVASCLSGSHVFAVSSDWAAKGNATAGTGQTIISQFNSTGQVSLHNWRTTSTLASSGSQTMNLTAPSAQQYNIAALEVRASGGATNGTGNAVVATANLAAVAPVVTGDGSVTAVAATDALAANAPVVSGGATVTAVVATVSDAAVAPTVTGGASVTGVAAAINAAAIPPSSVGVVTTVNAVVATASLAAVAPVVAVNASVTAVAATVSLAALAPTVSASSPGTVNAVVATATLTAVAPSVSGGASVTAVKVTVSTAAVAPTVALGATVSAVKATVAITALAPSVVTPDAQIVAVVAPLTMQAYAPQVSAATLVYVFRAPGYDRHYRYKEEPLIVRIPIPTPYSILKVNGFYQQVLLPTDEEVESADIAYLGGRDYQISSTERDALVAAGYGSYITTQVSA